MQNVRWQQPSGFIKRGCEAWGRLTNGGLRIKRAPRSSRGTGEGRPSACTSRGERVAGSPRRLWPGRDHPQEPFSPPSPNLRPVSQALINRSEDRSRKGEPLGSLVDGLIDQGEINILDPGLGPEHDKLSYPIATTYVDLPDGKKGLVVSNTFYPEKKVQIFDLERGELIGVVDDRRFNGASAMTSDGEHIYMADNATGLVGAFSSDGRRRLWQMRVPLQAKDGPGRFLEGICLFRDEHTRMIGSMAVHGDCLYVYNTALSKIQVFDKKTGKLLREIGRHRAMTLAQAHTENLRPETEVGFNGHTEIALLGDQILATMGGVYWEGMFDIPGEVMVISLDGELEAAVKLRNRAGMISGMAVDTGEREVFLAMGNTIGVWSQNGFIGEFTVPGCPGGVYGAVSKIHLDQESGDLIVCHHQAVDYDPVYRRSVPKYNRIITLSRRARKELMRVY